MKNCKLSGTTEKKIFPIVEEIAIGRNSATDARSLDFDCSTISPKFYQQNFGNLHFLNRI